MRPLALALIMILAGPLHAAVFAPGRGELAAWVSQSGTWEGLGTDAAGNFAMRADVDALYGGQFVMIRTRETRGDQVREQLQIFTGGEAPGAYLYEAGQPHRRLSGFVDAASAQLSAADATLRLTWAQAVDGLTGSREEASATGELIPGATWALKRAAAPSLKAARRGDVENFEYMDGELRGDGQAAVTPGQMASDHFQVSQTGVSMLGDTLVVSREVQAFDSGRKDEVLLLHFVEGTRPLRHAFSSRGAVLAFSGTFTDIGQMKFRSDVPGGQLLVHVVATCGGYKIVSELIRPDQPAAWLGDMELDNLAGSDKAMR